MSARRRTLGQVAREARCSKPSEKAFWLLPDGRYVPMACGRRDCPGCSTAKAVENALVVGLDAQEGTPPTLGLTLTTSDPFITSERFRDAVAVVFRRLRGEYGADLGYLGLIEFTTGRAARSGGYRRIHAHTLVKRLPVEASEDAVKLVGESWRRTTGATRVELEELRSPAAAIGYMVRHHEKLDQRPPADWVGKTFRPSKNYFVAPLGVMRAHVREQMRNESIKRRVYAELSDLEEAGVPDDVLYELALPKIAQMKKERAVPVKIVDGRYVHLATGEIVADPRDKEVAA